MKLLSELIVFQLVNLKKMIMQSVFEVHVPETVLWVWCEKLPSLYCCLQITHRVVYVSFCLFTTDSPLGLWKVEPVFFFSKFAYQTV